MLKIIWKQLLNRRKKNSWIALELLLVFCLVWFMVDYFFVLGYNKSIPSHRSVENTYMIGLGKYNEKHLAYDAEENEPANALANYRRIISRLKEHPDVETVGIGVGPASFVVLGASDERNYRNAGDTTKTADTQFVNFFIEEDYFRMFRHTKDNGKTPVSVADYNWDDPGSVIITRMLEEKLFPGESAIGKTIEQTSRADDVPRYQHRVIGVIDDVKNYDHLRPNGVMFIPQRLTEDIHPYAFLGIRTKGNLPPSEFTKAFQKEMSRSLEVGNYYLGGITSIPQIEADTNYKSGISNDIRTRIALMIFFLVNITLCVLGTFWYRVNVRKEEIGIRRTIGSDASGIRNIFIMEGLLLLTLIVLPAMLIESQLINAGLIDTVGRDIKSYGNYLPDHTLLRFLITNSITWLIIAAMVILAMWYPARSASRLKPVDALRDE